MWKFRNNFKIIRPQVYKINMGKVSNCKKFHDGRKINFTKTLL